MNIVEAGFQAYEMATGSVQGVVADMRNPSSRDVINSTTDNVFRFKASSGFCDNSIVTFSDDAENSTTGPVAAGVTDRYGLCEVPDSSCYMTTNDTDWSNFGTSMSEDSLDISHLTMPQLEDFERILQDVLSQDVCVPDDYPCLDIDPSSEDSNSGGLSDGEMFAGTFDESMVRAPDPSDHHVACNVNQNVGDLDGKLSGSLALQELNQDVETCSLERGLEIVKSLKECALAISEGNFIAAVWHSEYLQGIMSPKGNSMERVATYFTAALRARLGIEKGRNMDDYAATSSVCTSSKVDMASLAYQAFYRWCPYLMFSHFTANQAILEAFEGEEKLHIVDLDVKQGLQWPSLFQALSERPKGPPMISMTVIVGATPDLSGVMATRERILKFADALNVPLSYSIVRANVEDLEPEMLQIKQGEALVVNSMSSFHQLTARPSTSVQTFFRIMGTLRPSLVIIVEQDSNQEGDFFPQFNCALHYYCSMFDSVAASSLGRMPREREMVEKLLLAKDIMNIVGEQGQERPQIHWSANFWIQCMSEMGFRIRPASSWAVRQAMTLLLAQQPGSKYSLFHENGSLSCGWQEKPLYWVLSWHAV